MIKVLRTNQYNPGSREAFEKGCSCPVIDNHYGKGRPNGDFIYNEDCDLHTAKISIDKDGLHIE